MKRFTAATLAAATALSLAVAPSQAAERKSPSEVTDAEVLAYIVAAGLAEAIQPGSGFSGPAAGSSEKGLLPDDISSSLKNDVANGYKAGTTYDILVGTGIALGVLVLLGGGAAAAGLLPGIALPF